MKKYILVAACCYGLSAFATVHAQTGPVLYEINIKSVRDFLRSYPAAENAQWHNVKEGGSMCRFTLKGIGYRIYYSASGAWQGAICSYGEKLLDREIRATVKREYYDYSITFVDEMQLPEQQKVYLIQVQNEKELKILRVTDDAMEVIQEYKRG